MAAMVAGDPVAYRKTAPLKPGRESVRAKALLDGPKAPNAKKTARRDREQRSRSTRGPHDVLAAKLLRESDFELMSLGGGRAEAKKIAGAVERPAG